MIAILDSEIVAFFPKRYFDADISKWDTSSVTDMCGMFLHARSFNAPISNWKVHNVKNMCDMFAHAFSFNHSLNWDVSSVENMGAMFEHASSFEGGGVWLWDVSAVRNMEKMFYYASDFHANLSKWKVANVRSMGRMFCATQAFQGVGIDRWDVSRVDNFHEMLEEFWKQILIKTTLFIYNFISSIFCTSPQLL